MLHQAEKWASLALVLAVAAGCTKNGGGSTEPSGETGHLVANRAPEGEAPAGESASPGAPSELVLATDRVGPLSAETPAEEARLKELFPELTVAVAERSREGIPYQVFAVEADGAPELYVVPGEGGIERIEIVGQRARTEAGLGVGSDYDELRAAYGELECVRGVDDYGEDLLCHPAEHPNLRWVFPVDINDVPGGGPVPPKQAAAALEGAEAREVLWRPPQKAAASAPPRPEKEAEGALPAVAVKLLQKAHAAAAAGNYKELEKLLAARFTTNVDVKNQPRKQAIRRWKKTDPDALVALVKLTGSRGAACELTKPSTGLPFIECELQGVAHRLVLKPVRGGWKLTGLIAGD